MMEEKEKQKRKGKRDNRYYLWGFFVVAFLMIIVFILLGINQFPSPVGWSTCMVTDCDWPTLTPYPTIGSSGSS
jgi:hypothetical protein